MSLGQACYRGTVYRIESEDKVRQKRSRAFQKFEYFETVQQNPTDDERKMNFLKPTSTVNKLLII
jgi:hypothetical protein